jgi:hypothetical protein
MAKLSKVGHLTGLSHIAGQPWTGNTSAKQPFLYCQLARLLYDSWVVLDTLQLLCGHPSRCKGPVQPCLQTRSSHDHSRQPALALESSALSITGLRELVILTQARGGALPLMA